ncbi:MAG: choice-of-anchor L domain-containing protein, partial [Actinomycetota bacterium]
MSYVTSTLRSARRRATSLFIAAALSASIVPLIPDVAGAASITPTSDAAAIATALTRGANDGLVTNAAFVARPPSGNPTATSDVPLADFPSDGSTYAILSTGDATQAGNPDQGAFASVSDGGGNVRGDTDFDVTILRLDLSVPPTDDCLQIDFRFLSEEFPEFKGSAFNDAFIAQLDPVLGELSTMWTTSGSTITAPENFATDEDGNEVSVNGLGETRVTAAQAAGTIYDGATAPLIASTTITPGTHELFLSLFDQGDSIYDSAVFLDGLRTGDAPDGGCTNGARRQIANLAMTTSEADPPAAETTPPGIVDVALADVRMTNVKQNDGEESPTAPFGKAPFGKAPFGKAPFGKAPLTEYPLLRDGGWPLVLSHTCDYQNFTPQSVTWQQLFEDGCAPETFATPSTVVGDPAPLTLDDILIEASPLANFPLLAYLLGNETWNEIDRPLGGTWADDLSTIPACRPPATPAAIDTNASVVEGVLNGCDLELTEVPNHTIGDLTNPSATAFWDLTIADLNVTGSFLGDIAIADIPNPDLVVDCANATIVDCNTDTLRDVAATSEVAGPGEWTHDGTGRATGKFADLGPTLDDATLSDLVIAFLDPAAVPIEETPLTDFGFERLGENGNPTNFITYEVSASLQCLDSGGFQVHATLPQDFVVRPETSLVTKTGGAATPTDEPTIGEGGELTWQLSPSEGSFCDPGAIGAIGVVLQFDAMPGFSLGTFRSDVGAESDTARRVDIEDTAPVEVTDQTEVVDIDDVGSAPINIDTDSMFVGHLKTAGDVDTYTFDVPVGEQLEVSLSHLSKDYQLVVYAPDGSDEEQSLRPSTPAIELPVGTEPQIDPTGINVGVLPPPALQDIPFADGKVLAGISDFRGTDPEFLSTVGVAGTGGTTTYVAQVSGANAAHGNEPYVLTVRTFAPVALPDATPVVLPSAGTSGEAMPTTLTGDTLFLFDYQRTAQVYGLAQADAISDALDALVDPQTVGGINGTVLPLDESSAVGAAFAAWDADPANPEAMNDVVRAINDAVDALGGVAAVKNIVIVGDGVVIPHAAIVDETADGNEQGFAGDTFFGSEINYLTGALANGYFLSDAPYGALRPLSIKGQLVYLPQVAIGRLGGTVDGTRNDIVSAIERFVASNGVADPGSANTQTRTAFESDYDWFADGGDVIAGALRNQVDELERLSPNGTTQLPQWTRAEFADAFAGTAFSTHRPAGIISPNGHFDHYRMLPADQFAANTTSEVFSTADIRAGLSPTIYGGLADVNGDGVVDANDDANAFYGDSSIIDGGLDCDGWGNAENNGSPGDGIIDGSDDCTLIGFDGTATGVEITVEDGSFALPDGTVLPTVFNAANPDNPSVVASNFAWSVIDGRIDADGDGDIDGDDCSVDFVAGMDILGENCGFVVSDAAFNGLVDVDGDGTITVADTCDDCILGEDVTYGAVDSILLGRIIFSIGCHFGLDFSDGLPGATAGDPRLRDWAQALADNGTAVQIGNYGYGIGDTATVGFQEIILGDFAEGLDSSQTVGESLLGAQQNYFASMPSFTPYDLKILQELATWGMPMYDVPQSTGPANLLSTLASEPTFTPVLDSGITGVSGQVATVEPITTQEITDETPARVFFSNDGETQATHPYPIVPKVTAEIPPTGGEVAHGALPLSWDPIVETTINSGLAAGGYAFANATYDNSLLEDAPAADTVYPTTFGNIGTFYGADGAADQTLVVLTGQFRSGAADPRFGVFREYPSGDWLVLSSPDTTDFLPPSFTSVDVIDHLDGSTTIEVLVDDENDVGRVLAQVLGTGGAYTAVELEQPDALNQPLLWTSDDLGSSPREVTLFAADFNGNVGTANNGGPG